MDKAGFSKLDDASLALVSGGGATAGSDSLTGGLGNDLMNGIDGNDTMVAGGGRDTLLGALGNDNLAGQAGDDSLEGGAGQDTLLGGAGADRILGGAGSDIIVGGRGDDLLRGDDPSGNSGDSDQFHWNQGDGNDTIQGGGGTDVLVIEDQTLSLQTLLAGITPDAGSALPVIRNGAIDLTGVSGTLTIGNETIRFSGLERLVTGPDLVIDNR